MGSPRYQQLLDDAAREVEALEPAEAIRLVGSAGDVFVDVRDSAELLRNGRIPGSIHADRGMLEFYLDAESPFYKPVFGEAKRFVFYCAGGWRSALAAQTAKHMGLARVAHVRGGLEAWTRAGGPTARVPPAEPAGTPSGKR